MNHILFLFIIIFCFFCSSAIGKEPVELKEIVVTDEKEVEEEPLAGSATNISSKDYQNRIVEVSEILSEQAGIHLTRYGGLKDATSISIRGSGSEDILILYDGIPLNSATSNNLDLSLFSLQDIESLQIYRGSIPLSYGFSPSAGAINFQSKKIKKGTHGNFSAGYGSFNTGKVHGDISHTFKKLGTLFSLTYSHTDGDFSFSDDNGTPVNLADDQTTQRQNNKSWSIHPFLRLNYELSPKATLDFVTHLIYGYSGVPGFASNQSQTANLTQTEWLNNIRFQKKEFFHPQLNFESQTYWKLGKDQYEDLNGEIGLGGTQDTDNDTFLVGQKLRGEFFLGANQIFSSFILYEYESFSPEDFLQNPSGGSTSQRHRINLGIGDELDLFDHHLKLSPALWFENVYNNINNDDPSFLTPATLTNNNSHHEISARLGVFEIITHFLTLEGHISRGFRFPTFPELFGDRGGVVGNQFLVPEESIQWDLGFKLEQQWNKGFFNSILFSSLYFDKQIDDLILFQQNSGFARAENVGEAHIQGVETQLKMELFKHFIITTNYTFEWAKDEADNPGRFLVGIPQHEVDAKLAAFNPRGEIFFVFNWMDDYFLDPLNTRGVEDRIILNVGFSVKTIKDIFFTFEAKNLTNEQIVDVVGFPLPGLSFFGRLNYQF